MTPGDFERAAELFAKLRELPENGRSAALDAACAGDSSLRARVLRLLEADRSAAQGSFLNRHAIEDAAQLLVRQGPTLPDSGTVVGHYRLEARIGAGGMGVVYKAQDLHLERPVAVKILPMPFAPGGEERIERFQRESRAASQLNHPNIVSIFDAGAERGFHFIAMELVEGRTLRELSSPESEPWDAKAILDVLVQAASALSAAHDAGIVHRDIKPDNMMVRPDGLVKVLDFGLAKLRETDSGRDLSRAGNLAGTLHYLSPEQVLGKAARAPGDIFSLGVVAYELATGVRPFEGPTDGAVTEAILHHTPPAPSTLRPSLPPEFDGLIVRALEKDPELRFQTAGDLRSACRLLLRDARVRPQSPASPAPAAPTAAQSRSRLAAAGGFALLGAALAAAIIWATSPAVAPSATEVVQLTRDGLPKPSFVSDGASVFYAAGHAYPDLQMFAVSAKGGDPVRMPRLAGMFPFDISRDHSELLLGQMLREAQPFPLWMVDTLGSAPRRLGDLIADEACLSPRGDEILYALGPELWMARRDGSGPRHIATAKSRVHLLTWSPDGRSIRFTLGAWKASSLWEAAADGSGIHQVFPEWAGRPQEGGAWTPDGDYFVFAAAAGANSLDLWTMRRNPRWFQAAPRPVQLTFGPVLAHRPETSPDGQRIFFLGGPESGELVRYDRKLDRWDPYLGGLSAMQVNFSRDGKWIAYVSCPDGAVWKSAVDGSQRLQLTAPPLFARNPRFSPDGSLVTFYASTPLGDRVFLAPAAGGAVRQLTHGEWHSPGGEQDPGWSPDGSRIVYSTHPVGNAAGLGVIDAKTWKLTLLPGSNDLWSPRWSPDGRYIAALGVVSGIWLYDLSTGERKQLAPTGGGFPTWSADSKFVNFGVTTVWNRVEIATGKVETVASLKGLNMAPSGLGWVGLTPDGALMATRDAGSTEIYALKWQAR